MTTTRQTAQQASRLPAQPLDQYRPWDTPDDPSWPNPLELVRAVRGTPSIMPQRQYDLIDRVQHYTIFWAIYQSHITPEELAALNQTLSTPAGRRRMREAVLQGHDCHQCGLSLTDVGAELNRQLMRWDVAVRLPLAAMVNVAMHAQWPQHWASDLVHDRDMLRTLYGDLGPVPALPGGRTPGFAWELDNCGTSLCWPENRKQLEWLKAVAKNRSNPLWYWWNGQPDATLRRADSFMRLEMRFKADISLNEQLACGLCPACKWEHQARERWAVVDRREMYLWEWQAALGQPAAGCACTCHQTGKPVVPSAAELDEKYL